MSWSVVDSRGNTLRVFDSQEEAEARMDHIHWAAGIIEETAEEREAREVGASLSRQDAYYRKHPRSLP